METEGRDGGGEKVGLKRVEDRLVSDAKAWLVVEGEIHLSATSIYELLSYRILVHTEVLGTDALTH